MHRTGITVAVCLTLSLATFGVAPTHAADTITMDGLVVTVIDQVDVPAQETGVLESLAVAEGDHVKAGQLIGKLDARQIQLQSQLAAADLLIARKRSETQFDSERAKFDLALARQLADQQLIAGEIASEKADNDVRVQAATKATGIAKNEWTRANEARSRFADSVSKSELDSLRLAYQRSELETEQAKFDQRIDGLQAQSEQRESMLHQLRVRRAEVVVSEAESDQKITEIQTTAKQLAAELAQLKVDRHNIVAPIDGVIVQRYQRAGQWVQPGAAIVRIVRLDRLQAEGFLDFATAIRLRDCGDVVLQNESSDQAIRGKVTFVSPEVDPVNGKVRLLVQFDNPGEKIMPGMRVQLTANVNTESK